jgi:DNA-binding transcriptional ArsR family regulator
MATYPALDDLPVNVRDDFFSDLAWKCDALSCGKRLPIVLALLREGEMSVEQLGDRLDEGESDLIRRLMFLKRAGMVEQHRTRTQIYYSLETNVIAQILQRLQELTGASIEPVKTPARSGVARWLRAK